MEQGYQQCPFCKKKTETHRCNAFGECPKCDGRSIKKLMAGWKYSWPEKLRKNPKKKKKVKKMAGGKEWRSYNTVKKKNLATPLDETPTTDDEKALTDKV